MLTELRKVWQDFKHSSPGHRFQEVHEKRKEKSGSRLSRGLWMGAGLVLMAAGVVFLAMPGPGTVVLLVGVALVARESLWVARALDRLELAVRPAFLRVRGWWRRASHGQRLALTTTGSVLTLLASAALYFYVIR